MYEVPFACTPSVHQSLLPHTHTITHIRTRALTSYLRAQVVAEFSNELLQPSNV